ncbi:MAG: radical SAM protein [Nitrospinae bacterium]|nr:radical SAM protein [Nitrospinota bacterium]
MNILLINGNREIFPVPVMPLGLCKVASVLKESGYNVKVLDLTFEKEPHKILESTIKSFQPERVCIGIRNLDNADYLNTRPILPSIKQIIDQVRSHSNAPLIIGGAAINVIGERIKNYFNVDAIFIGEGEVLPGFIEIFQRNDEPEIFHSTEIKNIDIFPDAIIPEWIDVMPYLAMDSAYPIQTKRGCSYRCTYCTYPRIEGTLYRKRQVERILKEIIYLYEEYSITYFEFVDSVFNTPVEFANEICDTLAELPQNIKFVAGGSNPVNFTNDFVARLHKAHFTAISFTVESGSDTLLQSYQKGFTVKEMIKAAEILKNYSIPVMWIFLIGGSGETMETVEETLNFIKNYVKKSDVAYFNIGIRVYPETGIHETALKEETIPLENNLIDPTFYLSHHLNLEVLEKRLKVFSRKQPNFIYSAQVDGKSILMGYKIIHLLNLPRPAWRYTPYFNQIKNLTAKIFGIFSPEKQ